MRQVLPAKHSAVFDFALRLWLHLVVDVSQPAALLVQVDLGVDLDDGVFDQSQRPRQVLVLRCSRWSQRKTIRPQGVFSIGRFDWTEAGPSVLLRIRSTRTGYFVMRCVTSRMHSGTPNRRTMDKLLIF